MRMLPLALVPALLIAAGMGPSTFVTLTAINGEVAQLAPVLNEPPVANGVTVSSSNPDSPIDTLLKITAETMNSAQRITGLFCMVCIPSG